ncbi:MAG: hypothetical protein JW841_08045 [Deltaproteobacteria bacterium]|nr:hypothetical protein [Deltaproteobacteria bacterium]
MILTSFQTKMIAQLKKNLGNRHLHYRMDEAEKSNVGPHVLFYIGDIVIYVYTNEAGWMLGKHWQPFERPDFKSDEELISAFITEVIDVIQTGIYPEKSLGTSAIYFK